MMKKVLLGSLLVSSAALAVGLETAASSAAISSNEVNSGKYFYIAKNYQELASVPGFTMGAPAGLVPGSGVVFGSIGGTHNSDDTDGALGFGVGYGNPYETVGGAATFSIGSIDPTDGGAFNRGSLNLSLGHNFSQYGLGAAIGVSNIDLWHDDHADEMDPSFYGSLTKLLPNDVAPVIVTAGLGNNSYADVNETGDKKDHVYPFVSVAAYIMPQLSLIADYTSGITTLGVGIVPSPKLPITITMGAFDVNKQGTNDKTSFIGTLSAAYTF